MSTTAVPFTQIPVVSLADWRAPAGDRAGAARELVRVCHEVGFLTLVDHGVEEEFVERYFAALRSFFALPEDTKALIDKRHSRFFRGWERVGAELTDSRVDYREQLDLSTEHSPREPDVVPPYLRLDGPNQWLPEEALPGFRATVTEFMARMSALAGELMAMLAVGLDLPERTFERPTGRQVSTGIMMQDSSPC